MHRLSLLIALSLLCGCAARPAPTADAPPPQRETLSLAASPVASGIGGPPLSRQPALEQRGLPPLPSFHDRRSSAVEVSSRQGFDDFDSGGGALDIASRKLLIGAENDISWAVYQLGGVSPSDALRRISVTISSPAFGGDKPGYHVGVSNYAEGYWQFFPRWQTSYTRLLAGSEQYASPAGDVYVVVLIHGAQSVSVDSVELEYDDQPETGWNVLTLADGNSGWSPAITVDAYGSPWVAYIDRDEGHAKYKWGLAPLDLRQYGAWEPSSDLQGWIVATQSGQPDPDSATDWVDLAMNTGLRGGQPLNLPVASLVYTDEPGSGTESVGGVSAFTIGAQSQRFWLNYSFAASLDSPQYTSLDFNAMHDRFGMTATLLNSATPSQPPFELLYWTIDLTDPEQASAQLTTGFSEAGQHRFPHYRHDPESGADTVLSSGGTLYQRATPTSGWEFEDEAFSIKPLGSLAYNAAAGETALGVVYTRLVGGRQVLTYANYGDSLISPSLEEIDATLPVSSDWIGGASQLAYLRDGTPVVAYTRGSSSGVAVHFARREPGGSWTTELISDELSLVGDSEQSVLVDLGVEPFVLADGIVPSGRIWVVWNHITPSGCEFKVAEFNPGL